MPATQRNSAPWTIVCDFDGTIAPVDVTDLLLERFAAPEWLQLEKAWRANIISSRQCLIQQTELLAMTAPELQATLEGIAIDPAFVDFVTFANSQGCAVRVASEGYTQVIRTLLNRGGAPPLPVAATNMIRNGKNHWMLGHPFSVPDCATGAATCKCSVAREGRNADAPFLVIGDGRSDFCVAAQADFVFARGALLEFCREQALPHAAVTNFVEAREQLAVLLDLDSSLDRSLPDVATEQGYG